MDDVDAVVIGSGPNGLVAAALLARAGWKVTVLERNAVAGGAVHSAELTVPGYIHDTYSAFYGMLHASPVFAELGLDRRVEWAHFDDAGGGRRRPRDRRAHPRATCAPRRDGLAAPGERRTARPGSTSTGGGRSSARYFFAMMLGPLGSLRPRRAGRAGGPPRRHLRHGPDAARPARRAGDGALRRSGRPGAAGGRRLALRRRRRHARQRVRAPSSWPWRPSSSTCRSRSAGPAGWPRRSAAIVTEAGGVVHTGAEVQPRRRRAQSGPRRRDRRAARCG